MKFDFHTHKFTKNNLGNNYIEKVAAFIENIITSSRLLRIMLRVIYPFSSNDKLDYLANYLREQAKSTAQKVKESQKWLKEKYPNEDWGINILTVDFDHMKRGTPKEKFRRQLMDSLAVKYKNEYNKTHIKVFMGVDPRNTDLFELLHRYIKYIDGFKLYCYNGFFPYHEKLEIVYELAEMYNLPVLFHCSDTNINYYGGSDINNLLKESKFPLLQNRKGNKELSTNFCNPQGYEYVIMKYPKVNFIIAHWGGCDMFKNKVTSILLANKNAHADTSFFVNDDENKKYLVELFRKFPQLIDQTIFGSDAPMIEIVGGNDTVYSFEKWVSAEIWDKITTNYQKLYLK